MKEKQKGPVLQQELKKGSLPEMIKEAKETEEDIRGLLFCGEILEGEDLSRLYFRGVRMENCRFFNCVMERASFLDCVFSGCDFSNCRMEGSYFGRCQWLSGKAVGADFSGSVWKQVLLLENNFSMANLDGGRLEKVKFQKTDFSGAAFSAVKWKEISFEECSLKKASFFKTPLKGLDLTGSEIDGILLSDSHWELEGAVVSLLQAARLAGLLGVEIKEEL